MPRELRRIQRRKGRNADLHDEGNAESRPSDLLLTSSRQTPEPTHSLLSLIHTSSSFYPRFYTLQFLSQLLVHRAPTVQAYLISSPPPGVDGILSVLDGPPAASAIPGAQSALSSGASEMLRNEALLLLPALLAGNADLQKIVAFSGAFEKLISIIQKEGGIEGGIIVQDVLVAIGSLLRFNVSNQVGPIVPTRYTGLTPRRTTFASYPSSRSSRQCSTFPARHRQSIPRPQTILPCNTGPSRNCSMPASCWASFECSSEVPEVATR